MARFLADESCDAAVVQALRKAGYDLVVISERCPGADDSQVISIAAGENRILLAYFLPNSSSKTTTGFFAGRGRLFFIASARSAAASSSYHQ